MGRSVSSSILDLLIRKAQSRLHELQGDGKSVIAVEKACIALLSREEFVVSSRWKRVIECHQRIGKVFLDMDKR
jgi:hypothetical protein